MNLIKFKIFRADSYFLAIILLYILIFFSCTTSGDETNSNSDSGPVVALEESTGQFSVNKYVLCFTSIYRGVSA